MYELRFREVECGFAQGSSRPVMMLPSLKGWNREFIFLRGLDLDYMPLFKKEINPRIERDVLAGPALAKVRRLCEALPNQLTRDTFMNFRKMHSFGCEFLSYFVFLDVTVLFRAGFLCLPYFVSRCTFFGQELDKDGSRV